MSGNLDSVLQENTFNLHRNMLKDISGETIGAVNKSKKPRNFTVSSGGDELFALNCETKLRWWSVGLPRELVWNLSVDGKTEFYVCMRKTLFGWFRWHILNVEKSQIGTASTGRTPLAIQAILGIIPGTPRIVSVRIDKKTLGEVTGRARLLSESVSIRMQDKLAQPEKLLVLAVGTLFANGGDSYS